MELDLVGPLVLQGVEKDTLLERREGQDVIQGRKGFGQPVDGLLRRLYQREVGGGESRLSLPAMLQNVPKPGLEVGLEFCHLVIAENIGRPAQLELQPVIGHQGIDVPQDGVHPVSADGLPVVLVGEAPVPLVFQAGEAAEIVEGNLGNDGKFIMATVAQHAVANAVAGSLADTLLDADEGIPQVFAGFDFNRILIGKPADGAGDVGVVNDIFAAVAFEVDEDAVIERFSLPLFQAEAQAREEQVFRVGVVSSGTTAQKNGGGCPVEFKVETAIMNRGPGSIRGDPHAGFFWSGCASRTARPPAWG